ncbi:uncharacterized protein LOC116663180 isoform X1 [Camelus ferus]|uniref:Uncharacterized protein LOC116663180 isoform X1 n=1 Tax=Camelus ferus TaxID=419612 RepID=A0A8B8SV07_CAMFR|nr:uncharacterized protein LOC116663180 isoform X1 [Camelus ferus]
MSYFSICSLSRFLVMEVLKDSTNLELLFLLISWIEISQTHQCRGKKRNREGAFDCSGDWGLLAIPCDFEDGFFHFCKTESFADMQETKAPNHCGTLMTNDINCTVFSSSYILKTGGTICSTNGASSSRVSPLCTVYILEILGIWA